MGEAKYPSLWVVGFGAMTLFMLQAAAAVEGAGILLGIAAVVLAVLGSAVWAVARAGGTATPLTRRPADLLCVAGFVVFAVIAIFVDLIQAGAGPGPVDAQQSWAPALLKEAFAKWAIECDPLLAANPVWYWGLAVLSPLLYLPYYAAAAVAFAREDGSPWVRNLSLMWGAVLSFTTALIICEELWGQYPSPNRLQMLGGYLPYVLFPLFVVWRVWRDPLFPSRRK